MHLFLSWCPQRVLSRLPCVFFVCFPGLSRAVDSRAVVLETCKSLIWAQLGFDVVCQVNA